MFKLGLRIGEAPKLKFGSYLDAAVLPAIPHYFGYGTRSPELKTPVYIKDPGMLGNADWGDCVWAGAAHEVMYWQAAAGLPPAHFTDADVLGDYAAVTGFAFTQDTDQGTNMTDAAKYRQAIGNRDAGALRHKIDVYASLRVGDVDQVALATYLTGVAAVGVEIRSSDIQQFVRNEPFDLVTTGTNILGSHYLPILGRNSHGLLLTITWGRLQGLTTTWLAERMQQGIAYVDREALNAKGLSPQGFDLVGLNNDFHELTS